MKLGFLLVYVFVATAAIASSTNSSLFQIRLATSAVSEAAPPPNCDTMKLQKVNPATGRTSLEILYVDRNVLLDQNDLQATRVVTSASSGQPVIDVTFTDQGRRRFAEVTRNNIDRRLAIIIDGQVYSAPVIRTEIPGGKAEISGDFTQQEAEDLSHRINEALKR